MVDDATAGATLRVFAKWMTSIEVGDLDDNLSTVTVSATMPPNDLLALLKVLADAAS